MHVRHVVDVVVVRGVREAVGVAYLGRLHAENLQKLTTKKWMLMQRRSDRAIPIESR
jgi:hypothetical protein